MQKRITVRILLTFVCAILTIRAAAQDTPDPSKCFNDMLQNHFDFSQRQTLLLSALSIVDEGHYKDAAQNGSLSGAIPDVGLFKGDYKSYQKTLDTLFKLNKLDVNSYKETLLRSTWIGDRGYTVIETCLNNLALDRNGFHYKIEYASPTLFTIQFRWSSPNRSDDHVDLLDSTIINGNVDGAASHKLFRTLSGKSTSPTKAGSVKEKPFQVGKAAVPIFVHRESPSEPTFITVTTSLDEQPGTIRVDPVLPAVPLIWKTFEVEADPQGNPILHHESREIKNDQWSLTLTPPSGFEFAAEPSCTQDPNYPQENVHILARNWDQATNSYTCSGTQNGNPRFIRLDWTIGKRVESCIMNCA